MAEGKDKIYRLVEDLMHQEHRENALVELSRNRENMPDLAPVLWNSVGVMAVL
jgi:CCR4-NOT transcription complex subunit 9